MKKIIVALIGVAVVAAALIGGYFINKASDSMEETTSNESLVDFKIRELPEGVSTFGEGSSDVTPAMWRVTDKDGNFVYLLGTIHCTKDGTFPLPNYIKKAYDECEKTACEMNTAFFDFFGSENNDGRLEEGDSLKNHISPELYSAVRKYLKDNDMKEDYYDGYEPWYVLKNTSHDEGDDLEKAYNEGKTHGFGPKSGIDYTIEVQSNIDGKKILEMESTETRNETYKSFSDELVTALLEDKFLGKKPSFEESIEQLEKVYNGWKSADFDAVYDFSFNNLKDKKLNDEYNEKFIIDRNRLMVKGIKSYLKDGGKVFVMSGTAHYVGDESIPVLLEKEGYTVERVDPAAGGQSAANETSSFD